MANIGIQTATVSGAEMCAIWTIAIGSTVSVLLRYMIEGPITMRTASMSPVATEQRPMIPAPATRTGAPD